MRWIAPSRLPSPHANSHHRPAPLNRPVTPSPPPARGSPQPPQVQSTAGFASNTTPPTTSQAAPPSLTSRRQPQRTSRRSRPSEITTSLTLTIVPTKMKRYDENGRRRRPYHDGLNMEAALGLASTPDDTAEESEWKHRIYLDLKVSI